MRARALVLVVILAGIVSWAPTAGADAAFEDPAGDVVAQPAGATVPDNAQVQSTDISGLDVTEGDHDWSFALRVASLGQQGGSR